MALSDITASLDRVRAALDRRPDLAVQPDAPALAARGCACSPIQRALGRAPALALTIDVVDT
ncbi:MAG: hypothetical protein JSR18_12030 [Proteobacteria bacterium]|nr:hypothetical protein [Pseudomonadota bacterium]